MRVTFHLPTPSDDFITWRGFRYLQASSNQLTYPKNLTLYVNVPLGLYQEKRIIFLDLERFILFRANQLWNNPTPTSKRMKAGHIASFNQNTRVVRVLKFYQKDIRFLALFQMLFFLFLQTKIGHLNIFIVPIKKKKSKSLGHSCG